MPHVRGCGELVDYSEEVHFNSNNTMYCDYCWQSNADREIAEEIMGKENKHEDQKS